MLLLNPETFDTFRSQYKPKLALLIVIWLCTRQPAHLPLPATISSSVPPTPSNPPHPPVAKPPVPGSVTLGSTLQTIAVKELPVTPPYRREAPVVKLQQEVAMPVKGSTVAMDVNSSRWHSTTPPLSPPPLPPQRSPNSVSAKATEDASMEKEDDDPSPEGKEMIAEHEEEHPLSSSTEDSRCPIDYRGRPLCPNATKTPLSLRKRSSELADAASEFGLWFLQAIRSLGLSLLGIRLSPFFLFFGVLHLLAAVQLVALMVEDTIVRIGLSNPLPPDFAKGRTLGKRFARLKWRAKATWIRYWKPFIVLAVLVAVVGVVGREAWSGERGADRLDVPFGTWLLPRRQGDEDEGPRAKSFQAYRNIILLETVAALVSLAQPIKHVLPTSILPPTVSPSPYLFPITIPPPHSPSYFPSPLSSTTSPRAPATPAIALETGWLLSLVIDVVLSLVTLIQISLVFPSLPSYSPFSLSPHFIFHTARGRMAHIASVRQGMLRTIDCLKTVFASFPEVGDEGGDESDGDWICTVCFEGAMNDDGAGHSKATTARCSLPCGHKYHAKCLVHWLRFQSWCPVCHAHLVPISPTPEPPVSANEYPGAAAARRRRLVVRDVD